MNSILPSTIETIQLATPIPNQTMVAGHSRVVPPGMSVVRPIPTPIGDRPRNGDGTFRRVVPEYPPTIKQLWKYADKLASTLPTNQGSITQHVTIHERPNGGFDFALGATFPSVEELHEIHSLIKIWNRKCMLGVSRSSIEKTYQKLAPKLSQLTNIQGHFADRRYRCPSEQAIERWAATRAEQRSIPREQSPTSVVFNDCLSLCKQYPTVWVRDLKTLKVSLPEAIIQSPTNRTLRYNFGAFRIQLPTEYNQSFRDSEAKIIACTPRYCGGNAGRAITHPHVHVENLCTGTGSTSIENSFKTGRMFDVVDMINSVLNNYGQQNPYAKLEEWRGVCDTRFNPNTGEPISMDELLDLGFNVVPCSACRAEVDTIYQCSTTGCRNQVCGGCCVVCQANGCVSRTCLSHSQFQCRFCGRRFCVDMSADFLRPYTNFAARSRHFVLDPSHRSCNRCCVREGRAVIPAGWHLDIESEMVVLGDPPAEIPLPQMERSEDEESEDYDDDLDDYFNDHEDEDEENPDEW